METCKKFSRSMTVDSPDVRGGSNRILGHITFDQGQMIPHPNADGTTTLPTAGWYRLHVRLAERDYRMEDGR